MEEMNQAEVIKVTIEEFSRIQGYMQLCEKESPAYKSMKGRYVELKVILASLGVNTTEIDVIRE